MSESEQITHFANEVDVLVNRFRTEYSMAYASVVGVLQMKIVLLCAECAREHDPDNPADD